MFWISISSVQILSNIKLNLNSNIWTWQGIQVKNKGLISDKARSDIWFCPLITELCCIPDIDNKANSTYTTEVIVGTEWKM